MWLGIKPEGWLTIAAILLGPIGALLIQQWRDKRREDDKRKRQVFHQLLLTLKVPMAPRHVDALNSVPLEFYAKKEVIEAWRLYTSHLNNREMLKNDGLRWGQMKFDLLVDLAYKMGQSLGYGHIDKATLKDNVYVPQGYEDQEEQFRLMRETLLKVLRGQNPIPVTMVGPVQVEDPLQPAPELPVQPNRVLPARTDDGAGPPQG